MPGTGQFSLYGHLSVFLAVADTGSFVGASRKSGLPTSTVSRRIAELEDRLGLQLIRRTTRRMTLTAAGQAYSDRCVPLFEEIDEATRALLDDNSADDLRGRLRVTVPPLAGAETFGPWLFDFAARHPGLRLDLLVTNAFLNLVEDGVDLAFRLGPVPETSDIIRRLWSVSYVLCARPELAAGLELAHPEDLGRSRLVVTPPIEQWLFVDDQGEEFAFRPRLENSTTVTDIALGALAARSGLGIAYLPRGLVDAQLGSGVLSEIPISGWRLPERDMYAVFPPGRILSTRVRAAIDHVLLQRQGMGRGS